MKNYTKREALDELVQLDHAFINAEGVKAYTKPFGFMGSTHLAKANPQDFKGLTLLDENDNPIEELEGQAAHVVAEEIAEHLGLKFADMNGVGSRLRSACSAIEKYLEVTLCDNSPSCGFLMKVCECK